jgi:hypothetical protein
MFNSSKVQRVRKVQKGSRVQKVQRFKGFKSSREDLVASRRALAPYASILVPVTF